MYGLTWMYWSSDMPAMLGKALLTPSRVVNCLIIAWKSSWEDPCKDFPNSSLGTTSISASFIVRQTNVHDRGDVHTEQLELLMELRLVSVPS